MKNIIQNLVLDALLILIVLVLSILVFFDDYVFVKPVVWMERSAKFMVYALFLGMLELGGKMIYGVLFTSSLPSLRSPLFLLVMGGIFIFFALLGFRHREKIWSLA